MIGNLIARAYTYPVLTRRSAKAEELFPPLSAAYAKDAVLRPMWRSGHSRPMFQSDAGVLASQARRPVLFIRNYRWPAVGDVRARDQPLHLALCYCS